MRKKILLFLVVFLLGISGVKATCYKRTCPQNSEYPTSSYIDVIGSSSCKYEVVDDYYCSVNECAIKVTESGNSMECGRCGYSYSWNKTTKKCEVSEEPENASCAKNAQNSSECNKCTGYKWDLDTDKCVVDINISTITKVSCGNVTEIPEKLPKLTSDAITIIQIVVPIILIIIGSIDLMKGVAAQKEDEIKKGQKILIKRLITAAIIFFIVVIVKFLISVVANSTSASNNIVDCIDCFISNDCNR